MLNDHEPLTGSATCACSQHHVTIRADTDPRSSTDLRVIDLAFWERGSREGRATDWGRRIWHAWKWLRGHPEPFSGILLDKKEASRLIGALQDAYALTWVEEPPE